MKRGIPYAFLSALAAGTLALALVLASFARPQVFRRLLFPPRTLWASLWPRSEPSKAEIVARVNHGVVTVIATRAARATASTVPASETVPQQNSPDNPHHQNIQRGTGTGFVIDPAGLIVTNEHVIRDADRIRVKLSDGRERRAAVLGTDQATDLALLKIEAEQLTVLTLGDSDGVRMGDPVIAIGNPLDYEHSVTAGIISAKGRKVYNEKPFEDFLQTDAAINRGNSGGPLLNQAGEVIGVNTVIRIDGRGISFAVPSNVVKRVIAQLRVQGFVARGFLGLRPSNLTPELREGLGFGNLPGILVSDVEPNTPAAQAGIETYDVLTHFDGHPLRNTDDFFSLVPNTPPQRQVEIVLVRDGQTMRVRATLEQLAENETARPPERTVAVSQTSLPLGFSVCENTAETLKALRVPVAAEPSVRFDGGVVVSELDPLSPAAEAGLTVGHIIVEANRRPIKTPTDFQLVTEQLHERSVLVLRVGSPHQQGMRLIAIRVGEEK